jgi:hypothetical protein
MWVRIFAASKYIREPWVIMASVEFMGWTSAKTRGRDSPVAPGFGEFRVDVVHEVGVP